jgi:hypothetical protein
LEKSTRLLKKWKKGGKNIFLAEKEPQSCNRKTARTFPQSYDSTSVVKSCQKASAFAYQD